MRIDVNGEPYFGSYEQNGQDFTLHLDAAPQLTIGEEAVLKIYDPQEQVLCEIFGRKVQRLDGRTVYLHIDEEPSGEQDMKEALEILGVSE